MKIKKIKAKNFLCFGEPGIELDFEKLGNIVLIKGQNLDIGNNSDNASGKSSLSSEIICYALYGKVIKGLAHKEVINKQNKKNCEVQIDFDNYTIIRRRKPDSLEIYEDGKNITLGGMPTTQNLIDNIIRLNYEAFINVACFGEHNNHAFLSCDAATKRSVVENLLNLEKYINYSKAAREERSALESNHTSYLRKYEALMTSQASFAEQLSKVRDKQRQWKANKEQDIFKLTNEVQKYREELLQRDDGTALLYYQECQGKIIKYNEKTTHYENSRQNLLKILSDLQEKVNLKISQRHELEMKEKDHKIVIQELDRKLNELRSENNRLKTLDKEIKCKRCYGIINKINYNDIIVQNNNQISHYEEKKAEITNKSFISDIENVVKDCDILKNKKITAEEKIELCNSYLQECRLQTQNLMQVKKPEVEIRATVLDEKIKEISKIIEQKKKEDDPYTEIIQNAENENRKISEQMYETKAKMEEINQALPYYEYWIRGFGDEGIRAFIIDSILPALNARVNYWLQFLIDNKIQVKFDKFFEATIERNPPDGDSFIYAAMSGGEKRRVNLAISQAFAHIMMLSSQQIPSLISLDEVALNVDNQGVHGIYRMICELARDRQVLVTTHDSYLTDLLGNCQELIVQKKNGLSRVLPY